MKLRILTFFLLWSTFAMTQNDNITLSEAAVMFDAFEEKSEEFNTKRMFDSIQVYLEKMETLLPVLQDSNYNYRADLIRGTLLTRKTQADEALKVILKATEFFRLQENYKYYYRGRYKIGECYYYANQRNDTKAVMQDILDNDKYISESLALKALEKVGAINIELGMIKDDSSYFKIAQKQLREVVDANIKRADYSELSSNYGLLAENYNQIGDKEKTMQLLDSAIYYAKKGDNLVEEGFALIKKGNQLREQKKFQEAEKTLQKAVAIYKRDEDIPLLLYAYGEQKKLLKATNRYKAASELGDTIFNLTLRQYNERFADGVSAMRTKYNTAEKEREILKQQSEIVKRQYQIYGALALALLLSILGYVFYNQQRLKNRQLIKENKLKVALKEIETQNKLQEQRLQISRDLHDNIGAQLSFIISSIDNLKYTSKNTSEAFQEKLTYISEFTSTTIDQLRDTIWAMNKDEITITDLQSRTLAFIEKGKMAHQQVKFNFENTVSSTIIFSAIEGMHLFRVLQEAINNALKYAKTDMIFVRFEETAQQLIITIKDNGIGFEKESVQLGNGLYNMQKRMDEINAAIDIQSEKQKGTTIIVKYNFSS